MREVSSTLRTGYHRVEATGGTRRVQQRTSSVSMEIPRSMQKRCVATHPAELVAHCSLRVSVTPQTKRVTVLQITET